SFEQGWGRITLDDALYFSGDDRALVVLNDVRNGAEGIEPPAKTPALETGETHTFTLAGVTAQEPLEITLAWSDPAALPMSDPNLVNDLDLVVVAPDGTRYRGNVNFSGGESLPAGEAPPDDRNNVETVRLSTPLPGDYEIVVVGRNIPGNGEESPFSSARQGYALIATGSLLLFEAPRLDLLSSRLSGGCDGDPFLDPGEIVTFETEVSNLGRQEARSIEARLLVAEGSEVSPQSVTIAPESQHLERLAGGARETLAWRLELAGEAPPCGAILRLALTLSAEGVAPQTFPLQLRTTFDAEVPIVHFSFEEGLDFATAQLGVGGGSAPQLVACEHSGVGRPTPQTALKFGEPICGGSYHANDLLEARSPPISLPEGLEPASLHFWHRYETEAGFDLLRVELESGSSRHLLAAYTGTGGGEMAPLSLPLDHFTGITSPFSLRFTLDADGSVEGEGWYLDDVILYGQGCEQTRCLGDPPEISEILAASHPTEGGTIPARQGETIEGVRIVGRHFFEETAIHFLPEGMTLEGRSFVSDTELAVAAIRIDPEAPLGAHDLVVVNPDGQAAVSPAAVTLLQGPPHLEGITPAHARQGEVVARIEIRGKNLLPGIAVTLPGLEEVGSRDESALPHAIVLHDVRFLAQAPVGVYPVTATNSDGQGDTLPEGFTIEPGSPTLLRLVPAQGRQGERIAALLVEGEHFRPGVTLAFGGEGIEIGGEITLLSPSQLLLSDLSIASDAPLGFHDLTVTNIDGTTARGMGLFLVETPQPLVSVLSPDRILRGRSPVTVTIKGEGFREGIQALSLDPSLAIGPVRFRTPDTIDLTEVTATAAAFPGAYPFRLRNPAGGESTAWITVEAARIDAFEPSEASRGERIERISISGEGFEAGGSVVFPGGGIEVGNTHFLGPERIEALEVSLAPDLPLGPRRLEVHLPSGEIVSSPLPFTVTEAMPEAEASGGGCGCALDPDRNPSPIPAASIGAILLLLLLAFRLGGKALRGSR
ncbi:MAG: hypothetical protein D6812_03835, partial [Deltaproteobacteria bacterium]